MGIKAIKLPQTVNDPYKNRPVNWAQCSDPKWRFYAGLNSKGEMMSIEIHKFTSTAIDTACYDSTKRILSIAFKERDNVVIYWNVPRVDWMFFKNAKSAGKHYNEYIKDCFEGDVFKYVREDYERTPEQNLEALLIASLQLTKTIQRK